MEMVKELDIDDWEPFEIAEMIDGEISSLVPNWKKWDLPRIEACHTFNYKEDDGANHPFDSSSSCTSSQASISGLITHFLQGMRLIIPITCCSLENYYAVPISTINCSLSYSNTWLVITGIV